MSGADIPYELTVCIVVINDNSQVQHAVDSLARQSVPDGAFDVVVVDASVGRVTRSLVHPPDLRITTLAAPPEATPGQLGNLAWQAAAAAAVAFLAANTTAAHGWVENVAQSLRFGRRIIDGVWLPRTESIPHAGPLSYRMWCSRHDPLPIATGNLAMKRADLEHIGGFDESIEDIDVCYLDLAMRLVETGVDRYRSRGAVVFTDVDRWGLPSMVADRKRAMRGSAYLASRPRARGRILFGGVVQTGSQLQVLLAAAAAVLIRRDVRYAAFAIPWLHNRTCTTPRAGGRRRRWLLLPGAFIFDLLDAGMSLVGRFVPTVPSARRRSDPRRTPA